MLTHFNLRVYGIWIHEASVLVNEEMIQGRRVLKFPGGGLELGEGTIDGLKREWKEELDLDIEVLHHFYTTDFFQRSAFDRSQVISIYYFVQGSDPALVKNQNLEERSYWLPMSELNADLFTLPIDQIVGGMLAARHVSADTLTRQPTNNAK